LLPVLSIGIWITIWDEFSENCHLIATYSPNKEKDLHPPQVGGLSFALINKGERVLVD